MHLLSLIYFVSASKIYKEVAAIELKKLLVGLHAINMHYIFIILFYSIIKCSQYMMGYFSCIP